MPEGNTIHRLARIHTRDFGNRRVAVSSPQGRFAKEAGQLDGRRFNRAEAYGKHLFHHWSGGLVVHVHLGMAGWFYRHGGRVPEPKPTVRMRLGTRKVVTDLIGPPTCEIIPEFARRSSSPGWAPILCGRTSTRSRRGHPFASGLAARLATLFSTSGSSPESGTSIETRRCSWRGFIRCGVRAA